MQPDESCPVCEARLHHAHPGADVLHCQECGGRFSIASIQDGSAYRQAREARDAPPDGSRGEA